LRKSVTNIQAAFRGYHTRKAILSVFESKKNGLTPYKKTNTFTFTRPPLSSPSPIDNKVHLGKTAAMMARRRQTISSIDACPPVPPSPGMTSVGSFNSQNDFASPPNQRIFFSEQSPHTPRVLNVTTAGEMSSLDADAVIARAKSRKSSIMLQRRLKRNTNMNNLKDDSNSLTKRGEMSLSARKNEALGENFVIAHQLLTAHKCYIDELMEGLKTEMDCIRDFEFLLEPDENGRNTLGPTEDQVLSYFESVVQFLDKGTNNGNKLRLTVDKICRAEATTNHYPSQPNDLYHDSPSSSMGKISSSTPPTEI